MGEDDNKVMKNEDDLRNDDLLIMKDNEGSDESVKTTFHNMLDQGLSDELGGSDRRLVNISNLTNESVDSGQTGNGSGVVKVLLHCVCVPSPPCMFVHFVTLCVHPVPTLCVQVGGFYSGS